MERLIDEMIEYAARHWKQFVYNGSPYVDEQDLLEHTYERLYNERMPDKLYNRYINHPEFKDAVETIYDIVQEELVCHVDYAFQTMDQKLREVGMSIRDFI